MLRLVRGDPSLARFDGRFFEKDDRFWPLAPRARVFADRTDWPDISSYDALLPAGVGVRFEEQTIVPRRRGHPQVRRPEELYDARIVRGEIPTRARSWHDYLNALVWATFPRAKAVLHARQHEVISRWLVDEGAIHADGTITTLPNARTREHDALALVDEGGIVVLRAERELPIVFGHALYEGMVMGTRAMIARGVEIPIASTDWDRHAALEAADEQLAARLAEPLLPEQLPRYSL